MEAQELATLDRNNLICRCRFARSSSCAGEGVPVPVPAWVECFLAIYILNHGLTQSLMHEGYMHERMCKLYTPVVLTWMWARMYTYGTRLLVTRTSWVRVKCKRQYIRTDNIHVLNSRLFRLCRLHSNWCYITWGLGMRLNLRLAV